MKHIFQTIQHTARAATVLLLALLAAQTAWAQEAISGLTYNTAGGYYEISDAQDLASLATYVNGGNNASGKTFKQTQDITLTEAVAPIGNSEYNYFSGTYDGGGYTISGLNVSSITENEFTCSGLFGRVQGANLHDIVLISPIVSTSVADDKNTYVGPIVAFTKEKSTQVSNCTVINPTVTLPGGFKGCAGAIVGRILDGRATNCHFYGGNQSDAIGDNWGTVTNVSRVYTLTATGCTATATATVTVGTTSYYNSGTAVSLTAADRDGYIFSDYSSDDVTITDGAFTMPAADVAVAATFAPDPAHFSVNDAGTEYTIHTATGWGVFCDCLNDNDTYNRFSGKTVQLDADITVTRMAGGDSHDFCGTFDGGGHTLTVTLSGSSDRMAPFSYISNVGSAPAAIRNLNVVADITSSGQNASALVGEAWGKLTIEQCTVSGTVAVSKQFAGGIIGSASNTPLNISNCISSVTISSSKSGDGTHGGFAGRVPSSATLNISGCVFDGKIITTSGTTNCGGFVGHSENTAGSNVSITNSLYAPTADDQTVSEGCETFCRNIADGHITNSYYTAALGTAQGKALHTVTAGTDVTIEAIALTGTATQYTVSGITAYSGGGLQRGETLYYGIDDVVSLTLSNTATGDVPDGYQYGYTTNAGTLEGSTLTMPDQDVTVSVNTDVLVAIDWATVSTGADKDNAYMIYNKDQLDLLAHRVNGTHGETRRDDGYSGKYFQLAKDISYPHKADGEEGADAESNYEAIGGYYDGDFRSFRGHFDGNNKTISGIRIYKDGRSLASDYQGIFGRTGSGADIHDLTLADARITGCTYTGGIVGENNDGTVTGCHVAGDVAVRDVQSGDYHGGIVGNNDGGTIEQCTSAATLTTADANNSRFYGGIAGWNYCGTLCDNLAIGATVPAAADNTYGAITGHNYTGGTLQRNYYAACKVANTPNATGVGCGCIDDGNGGRIVADVNNDNYPDGARAVFALTLADGITTTTAATVTFGTTGYYAQGTAIALSYSGDVPLGYQYAGFTASAGTLSGSTLTMPDQDVTVSVLRSTGEAVEVSYVDAGGTTLTHDAVALDGTESILTEGWYFVGTDIAFDHTLELYGDVHLILPDGCTMNVTSSNGNGIAVDLSMTIYGQTDGTGTLNATGFFDGIYTDIGTITISGGTVTATGENGTGIFTDSGTITISGGRVTVTGENGLGIINNSGTITLGCTTASDFIYVSSYFVGPEGSLNIADGQTLFDEDGNPYSGNGVTIPDGKTLRPGLTARQAPDGNYWTTYYNGTTGFTIGAEENACAYTATYGAGQLTLHNQGKEIPAGTAVIIVADNDVVSMATADLDAFTDDNDLHGVDVDTDVDDLGTGTFYVLGMTTVGGDQHFGFHRYTGSTMAAHKAFVLVSGSQALARSLTMVFDEASGIESLTPAAAPKAQAAQHWFTLDGRRLQAKPTAPGIYINNGRKVVIK